MPTSGDVRFARGFVHQHMGANALALADCSEAIRLGTEFAAEAETCRRLATDGALVAGLYAPEGWGRMQDKEERP